MEDEMLPGFSFHPTDEELVGFYLKRKVKHQTIPIELIKQFHIYKYNPWDLPKMSNGEKEWCFLCSLDRKYRNSMRPNRVTGGGFWKATGTDGPIYSSGAAFKSKCIGLKKSLVFCKGRAARGTKTDCMMHEFDAWTPCRIFKKTSAAPQRAKAENWVISPVFQPDSISFTPPDSEPECISNISFSPNTNYTFLISPSTNPQDFLSGMYLMFSHALLQTMSSRTTLQDIIAPLHRT